MKYVFCRLYKEIYKVTCILIWSKIYNSRSMLFLFHNCSLSLLTGHSTWELKFPALWCDHWCWTFSYVQLKRNYIEGLSGQTEKCAEHVYAYFWQTWLSDILKLWLSFFCLSLARALTSASEISKTLLSHWQKEIRSINAKTQNKPAMCFRGCCVFSLHGDGNINLGE